MSNLTSNDSFKTEVEVENSRQVYEVPVLKKLNINETESGPVTFGSNETVFYSPEGDS